MKPEHKRYILENINKKPVKKIAQELNLKERNIRKFLEKEEKEKKEQIDLRKETKTPLKKRTIFISIILIIILGFAVYGNSLNGEFLWDDEFLVEDNAYIKSWSHISKLFTENIGAGAGGKYNFYRPLQMITYMIDYSLCKLDVKGYHFTNILLHISVALGLYWLVNILYKDKFLSLLTSILFVVHPIHTEAVAYISSRADLLAGLFMLLCFIFYIKYLHSENIRIYILILLWYICALLSKENTLILPVLLFLYHYTFKKKLKVIKHFSPILSITVIYILLRFTVLKAILFHTLSTATLFQRIPGFFAAITNYIKLLFLPFSLHMEYGYRQFSFTNSMVILGIVILISSITYALRKRNTNNLIFFSISWFFITLLPQSDLYPINAYMAEHWLYLPSIGFFLILANGLNSLYRRKESRILTICLIAGLLTFYSYLTIRQNSYWREPLAFYKRTSKYVPDSPRIYTNLGNTYRDIGKNEEAIILYKKAIAINPNLAETYYNLASIYCDIDKKEAIVLYKKAIAINPDLAEAYYNLGSIYHNIDKKEAIVLYKKAIAINPDLADAYNNLGNIYRDIDKKKEAIVLYKKAIAINPDFAEAYNNLGSTYCDIGKKEEAIVLYKKAIAINTNLEIVYYNLAVIYYNEKQYNLAIKHCNRAVELGYKVPSEFLKLLEPYRK